MLALLHSNSKIIKSESIIDWCFIKIGSKLSQICFGRDIPHEIICKSWVARSTPDMNQHVSWYDVLGMQNAAVTLDGMIKLAMVFVGRRGWELCSRSFNKIAEKSSASLLITLDDFIWAIVIIGEADCIYFVPWNWFCVRWGLGRSHTFVTPCYFPHSSQIFITNCSYCVF